jgi:hypothetical protein
MLIAALLGLAVFGMLTTFGFSKPAKAEKSETGEQE